MEALPQPTQSLPSGKPVPPAIRIKKSLGQHFLVDRGALAKVIRAADLAASDIVVEVGPGLGILTRELAQRVGRIIAVELDEELAQQLRDIFVDQTHVSIIQGNILKLSPQELVKLSGKFMPGSEGPPEEAKPGPYKVVANLPYYITSPVLRHFLESSYRPTMMVVMVQREVAESIVARPGDMSLLSVAVQFYGKPRIVAYVPPKSFRPPPKVESAILKIDVYPHLPWDIPNTQDFFRVTRAGFVSRRKQLRNALAIGLAEAPMEAAALLESAEIDPSRRAQTLGLEEWAKLSWALAHRGDKGI